MCINPIPAELFLVAQVYPTIIITPNPLRPELDMLLIIFITILSSVKLFSNVKDIFALTPPQQSETLIDRRFNGLRYLIHFIAAKNLQLFEADNINHHLGVGDLRKKGEVNWLCLVNTLFYRLLQFLIRSLKVVEV